MMDKITGQAIQYARNNHDTFLDEFLEFLKIPSVSTDPAYSSGIRDAAEWIQGRLEALGFGTAAVLPTEGHPVVYGYLAGGAHNLPTVLLYAHYDVQPVDPVDLWDSPPFDPQIRDGKLFARGASDDKFGVFAILKSIEAISQTAGRMPFNVKVLFEGEEETGSPHLETFVREHTDELSADLLVVCDGGHAPQNPSYLYSVRGIVAAEVHVNGPERDFHSGIGGGAIHNPLHAVADIIASFQDETGHVLIPGFYDGIIPLTEEEERRFAALDSQYVALTRETSGDFTPWGEPGYGFIERTTARPSLDVNGITGGYQGDGTKTVIPAHASFKVSMRLAPNQDPDAVWKRFENHVMAFNSETVHVTLSDPLKAKPALLLYDSPVVDAMNKAFEEATGRKPEMMRMGGSLPLLGMFDDLIGMPMVVFGISTGAQVHSPNEHIFLDYFDIDIETSIRFYAGLGAALWQSTG